MTYKIIGTDEARDECGVAIRRYVAGTVEAESKNKALYAFLRRNGYRRVTYSETGSSVTKTTFEAKEIK